MTTKTTLGVVDPEVLDRSNHTGTQSISTVSGLQTELNSKADIGDAPYFLPRAWVRFDGVVGVTVAGQGNISSVVKEGTGVYLVTLSTPMSDPNYSVICSGGSGTPNRGVTPFVESASQFRLYSFITSDGSATNLSQISAWVIGS